VLAVGQVFDRRLREGPCWRRGAASRQRERKDFVYVGKVGTGFNRKSMEIRKKLDAILSSKSRLAKAPRLKGATWVLRADR
jgi:ATP-dependent DNA ligase